MKTQCVPCQLQAAVLDSCAPGAGFGAEELWGPAMLHSCYAVQLLQAICHRCPHGVRPAMRDAYI